VSLTGGGSVRRALAVALLVLAGFGTGCATVAEGTASARDPWEPFNRRVFEFNDAIDREVTKPVAEAYQAILPQLVRTGVTHFFGNLGDAWSSANLLLQAKPRQALEMGMRTLVNSTFGLGGVLDFAGEMGLERFTVEDVGQTLGYWGIGSGPYLVLPLLGPSTVRDGIGLIVDYQQSTINYVFDGVAPRNAAGLLNLLNTRTNLLSAGRVFDQIALDRYTLLRDGYLARRRSLLYDGEPPDDEPAPAPYKSLLKRESAK
jgi:phospholipid-binding lipoprotein MlaA